MSSVSSTNEIRTKLDAINAQLREIACAKREIVARLRDLDRQEALLEDMGAQLRSSFGPHYIQLPPELLSKIFEWATVIYDETRDNFRQNVDFALTISHVSHHWHDASINNPRLWTYIYFNPETPKIESRCKEYLVRSGTCLLDVVLNIPPFGRPLLSDSPHIPSFLLSELFRWRSCYIEKAVTQELSLLLRAQVASALHVLHFDSLLSYVEPFGGAAPQLESLAIRSGAYVGGKDFDFPGLRTLCIRQNLSSARQSLTGTQFSQFLTPFTQLRTLRIWALFPVTEPDAERGVHLPNLTELYTGDGPLQGIRSLLTILSAPKLEQLHILDTRSNLRDCLEPIAITPFPLPFPELKSLRFSESRAGSRGVLPREANDNGLGTITSLLRAISPELRELSVSDDYWETAVAEIMIRDSSLCPKLSSLSFTSIGVGVLRTLVSTRENSNTPVKELTIGRRINTNDYAWFSRRVKFSGTVAIDANSGAAP
jgi:hypothetical protein